MNHTRGATTGPPRVWTRVIVVDGDDPVPGWGRLVAPAAEVIAADGGACHASGEGVTVTDLVGDLDSVESDFVEAFQRAGGTVHRFDRDKDFTDFELAAQLAADRSAADGGSEPRSLLIVGGAGGRLDHQLANVAVLAGDVLAGFDVTAILGHAVLRVARPGRPVTTLGTIGRVVSLLPFGAPVDGVTTTGLRFALRAAALDPFASRAVSNEAVEAVVTIRVESGSLVVVEPDAFDELLTGTTGSAP
ncbi:MAG: thiamine diphosphokinase [Actinobacteria bacterium]|nr:thiamine diphosphokinase [Actinomycetota bacterium]